MTVRSSDGVDVAVHDLAAERAGRDGATLLVAHATGLHGRCYAPMAASLPCEVIALDARGHGDTAAPAGWHVTWDGVADDVQAVAEHIANRGPVVGFGHSMGGTALLIAALRRPQLFAALVVFEPIVFPPDTPHAGPGPDLAAGARRRRATFRSVDEARAHFASRPPLSSFTPAALSAYVEHGFHPSEDGGVRLACDPELEASLYEAGAKHDTWRHLGAVAPAVWVIAGRVASGQPSALAATIADLIPRGTYVEMPDLGHFGPLTHPDQVAAVVRDALTAAGS